MGSKCFPFLYSQLEFVVSAFIKVIAIINLEDVVKNELASGFKTVTLVNIVDAIANNEI